MGHGLMMAFGLKEVPIQLKMLLSLCPLDLTVRVF
jgi:hypothetical protein